MATVVALIQLTQGVNVGTAGQALVGTTGSSVSVANNDNTNVASWKIDLVYVPTGSALSTGTLASANSATPAASFTPDVTGSYRLVLTVWDTSGQVGTTNTDIRNFSVKETGGRGFLKPPAQIYPLGLPPTGTGLPTAKPDEMNFSGQPNGWSGTTGDGLFDDIIKHVDKTGILTSSAPADVTKAAAAVGTSVQSARADHKHDVSTATTGAAAIGDSAAEGTATSLARSDHKHSIAAGTPVAIGTANATGAATTFPRSDHVHDHGSQSTGTHHAVVTSSVNGFMSAADKVNFDSIVTAVKQPVRAATTANITLSGTQTVDGVSLVANDRCLVKDQSTGANNGIYVVAAGAWTRSTDFDADAEVRGGLIVPVSEGTANGNRVAQLTTNDPITVGSTALVFSMAQLPPLTSTAPADVTKAAAAVGTSTEAARADHKHDVTTATPATGAVAVGNTAAEGSATTLARSDHQHTVTAGTPVAIGTANATGAATTFPRSDHVHDHGTQSTGTHHAVATTSLNGFMSSGDKGNFDITIRGIKGPVRAATTANITLSGTQTVDGVSLVAGDRCLVKNQSTGANNGIYDVASGAWTRSVDFDADTEVRGGLLVPISEGTANGDKFAMLTTNDPITIGSTALVFSINTVQLTSTAPVDVTKAAAAVGTAPDAARADHKHDVSTATPAAGAVAIGNAAAEGSATSLARSDHTHTVTGGTPVAIGTANADGVATTFPRSDHVHDHGSQSTGTHHAVVTTSVNGFMLAADKSVFDTVVRGMKQPVRVATTANITLSGSPQTIDGVSVTLTERVLVKNQSTGSDNGIYVVSPGAWSRAVDFNASTQIRGGTMIPVSEGTTNGDRVATLTTNDPITLGTTALAFTMSSAGSAPPGTTGNIPFNNTTDFAADAKLTYDDSTDQLTVPGVNLTEDFALQGDISPSQITADQNDYNPTNLATSTVLRLTSDATRTITGLQGGADGRLICLLNVGSNDIVLANESASSTAGNRFTIVADLTMPPTQSILLIYDSTSSRWRRVADATRQVLLRTQFGAADFDDPATDWSTTAAAAIAQDTVNAGLTVRRFDDTTDEGVGWDAYVPAGCTKVRLTFMGRAQTAPAATRTVGLAFKKREIVNNSTVGSWTSTTLTDVSIPANANFQRSSQTVTLSTLSITADRFWQLELVRQNPAGGTELVGDWTLFSLVVEWLA